MATRETNPLTIDSVGRRHYICGDTYPIKDKLRAAGFKWDPDRKCWWTGKKEEAEKIVGLLAGAADEAQAERDKFRIEMDRRRAEGLSLSGTACKADEAKRHGGVWDKQREIWLFPSREAMAGCQADSAKRRGERKTEGGGRGRSGGAWNEVPLVGERTDRSVEIIEPGGGKGYKPEIQSLLGTTKFTKVGKESVPMTTVGAEAYYIRGEDAEDQGDYGGSGWRITKWIRPATPEESAPILDARATQAAEADKAKAEQDRLQAQWQAVVASATEGLLRIPGIRKSIREIARAPKASPRDTNATVLSEVEGGVQLEHYMYDDHRSYLYLPHDEAVAELDNQIERASKSGYPITVESARKWLAQYSGCEGKEVQRRAAGLDPWGGSDECRTTNPSVREKRLSARISNP